MRQLSLDDEDENTAIGVLATAYDVAALDSLVDSAGGGLAVDPASLRTPSPLVSGASRAFTLHGALPLPRGDAEATLYRILHIAALAVVGHREIDFAEWLSLQGTFGEFSPPADAPWDVRLRAHLANVWLSLMLPQSADTYESVIARLGEIREQRADGEVALLAAVEPTQVTRLRFHLFTLYHLVDAAAALTMYLSRGEPADVLGRLSLHFTMARSAATGESMLDIALAWLHGAVYVLARRRSEQLSLPGLADNSRRE
jgi:hypothetical protein